MSASEVSIEIIDYDEKNLKELRVKSLEKCLEYKNTESVTWINVNNLDQGVISKLLELFEIHQIVLHDILDKEYRSRIVDFGDYLFISTRMIIYSPQQGDLRSERVCFLLGKNFVITFQEKPGDVFDSVREHIKNPKSKIRRSGADYLVYALIDAIVNSYFEALEYIGEYMEDIEDKLITNPSVDVLHSIYLLKRDLLFLRRAIWPMRDVIDMLGKGEIPLIKRTTAIYFRDLYNHVSQAIETIETFREMLSSLIDLYLSSASYRTNEIMKVLTVIATIFIPITFIASVYGMNFKYMPELYWKWSYPIVLLVMFAISVVMLVYFKRKGWL
ncbi:MAG: magnesium/cobalt transporter CorA [Euryarchaeota archaeon]|nr:magnesium/cobalt transporter CorA [Euryarchaeota archaeon]